MTPQQFENDVKTVDAVVRNFIVIGEASRQMPEDVRRHAADVPWRLMADMRDFAVHRYWGVDTSVLWRTIRDDLPPLVCRLQQIRDGG